MRSDLAASSQTGDIYLLRLVLFHPKSVSVHYMHGSVQVWGPYRAGTQELHVNCSRVVQQDLLCLGQKTQWWDAQKPFINVHPLHGPFLPQMGIWDGYCR